MAAQTLHYQWPSTLTLEELRYCVENMQPGQHQTALRQWLEETLAVQSGARMLPVDTAVAHCRSRALGCGPPLAGARRAAGCHRNDSQADPDNPQHGGFHWHCDIAIAQSLAELSTQNQR